MADGEKPTTSTSRTMSKRDEQRAKRTMLRTFEAFFTAGLEAAAKTLFATGHSPAEVDMLLESTYLAEVEAFLEEKGIYEEFVISPDWTITEDTVEIWADVKFKRSKFEQMLD